MACINHDENGNLPTVDPRSPEQQLWDAIEALNKRVADLEAALAKVTK